MYLTVGEISKALGISAESIRYYVKEGIITPRQNKDNSYWEYSSEDLLKLTDVMFYRSMGLTIEEIKSIMGGLPLEEIRGVIEKRKTNLIREVKKIVDSLAMLTDWECKYSEEMGLIGRFKIGEMPAEFRREGFFEEEKHMARYLEENFDFDKEDWASVSISFFYDINEEAPKLHRYISIEGEQKVKLSNLSSSGIEERAENCLITEVHYSEDPDVMIQPVIDYARENGLRLEGTFYGREDTNYFTGGKRGGLFKVYAPITKK